MYQRFKNYELKTMRNFALVFVAAMLLSVTSAQAQDIIMLKTGDDIEALVEKVGDVEIEYRKWDNQTGPVYVVKTDKVFMIKYRNGFKQMFNTPAKPPQAQTEQTQQPPSTPLTPLTPSTSATTSSSNLQTEFYLIGDDDKAMLEFFRRNNFSSYYNDFNKACKGKKSANALLGIGLGFTGGGIILMACGAAQAPKADDLDKAMNLGFLMYAGGTLAGTGHLLIIASIPTYAVAASRKKAIKNNFAKEYFGIANYTYQPKLNFGTTANGIGLTFNF